MKQHNILIVTAIAAMILFMAVQTWADDPKARDIMQHVEDLDDGDNRTALMEMILIDKQGKERLREIKTYSKDKGPDTYQLMFFRHPADVKNTAFLTYDYDDPERDDDQWLYLPALRKTKRIATSDKSGSFMGSDLSYADMTSRNLEDYDFVLKQEMKVRGNKVWVIESTPRSKSVIEETGYTKSLLFVRQDIYFVVRGINWVKDGGYLKYTDVKQLKHIDGVWVATEIHVTKKRAKATVHKTILRLHDVKFNQPLTYDLFSIRRMEKGL
jgi:hypothetical protein